MGRRAFESSYMYSLGKASRAKINLRAHPREITEYAVLRHKKL